MLRNPWLAPLLALLVGAACGVHVVAAQEHPPTNFELVREAARLASEQLVANLQGVDLHEPIALQSASDHEGDFLVENTLSGALTQAGYPVRTRPDSIGPILEFQVVDLGLAYTRVRRHAWFGDKKVERQARARLFARVIDQEKASILWAAQEEAKVVDEVRHADLGTLEEKSESEYLQASMPPRRWNKIVEPVVVTGIVVGLIVLFFSNQDASN